MPGPVAGDGRRTQRPYSPCPLYLIFPAAKRQVRSEQKANLLKSCCIARLPETDPILSREELAEFTRRLTMLSADSVEGVYRTAHREATYDGKKIPPAAAVQQLVAAWKVLRKMPR